MADWNLLQPMPNFTQQALVGYQAGQAIGKQKRLDAALQSVDLTRPETILPALQADPATGISLLSASTEMAKAQHETAGRVAAGNYLAAWAKAHGQSGSGGAPSPPTAIPSDSDASTTPASPIALTGTTPVATSAPNSAGQSPALAPGGAAADPSSEIVVTAKPQPDQLTQARLAYMQADPAGYLETETKLSALSETQRKAVDAATGTFDNALQSVKSLPYEQRAAAIQQHRADLIAAGVPAQQIDSFDPTDGNITAVDNQVLGIKGILDQKDKDRSFALDQQKFGETQRHDRADEATAASNAATSRGQLGVAQGNLSIRQKEFNQKQGSGGSTIATPTTAAEYNALAPGTRYYKDGQVRIKQ